MKNLTRKCTFLLVLFNLLISFLFITSCQSSATKEAPDYATTSSKYRDTTGPINVLTVVSDSTVYNALYPYITETDVLGKELPGSFIPQSFFGFRNYSPRQFDNGEYTRAVLIVKKGKPKFVSQPSKYAKYQAYMEVYGNNIGEIKQVIQRHKNEILSEIERANFSFLADKMENDHADELEKLGVYMKIPRKYNLVLEEPNYQWYRLDKINTSYARNTKGGLIGSQRVENFNIQIDTVTIGKSSLSEEDIKTIVNVYGLNKLISDNENPLQIQKEIITFDPVETSAAYHIYNFDGMWEIKDEPFGGSFVGRIILNKETQKMYFALVSINSPEPEKKRENIVHALSMIKSFKVLKEK